MPCTKIIGISPFSDQWILINIIYNQKVRFCITSMGKYNVLANECYQ